MILNTSSVVLTGDGSGAIQAGNAGSIPVPAIDGTGSLDVDPNVVLLGSNGGTSVGPGIATTTRSIPSLRSAGEPPGGTLDVELFAPAGDLYLVFVGLPSTPVAFSQLQGSAWLLSLLLAAQGVQGAPMRTRISIPLPNSPLLVGLTFTWQALAGPGISQLALSNPSTYVHPQP